MTHLRQYEVHELVLPRSVRGLRRTRKTWHDNPRQVRHRCGNLTSLLQLANDTVVSKTVISTKAFYCDLLIIFHSVAHFRLDQF